MLKTLRRRMLWLTTAVLILIAGSTIGYRLIGIAYKKRWTNFQCFYMTMVTITTTGYGEILPGQEDVLPARALNIVVMLLGAGIVVYFFSTVTAFVVEGHLSEVIRRNKMLKYISRLKDHFIICGADETARHIIAEMLKTKRNFVVVESDVALIEKAQTLGEFFYIIGDATIDDNLIAGGISKARGIIVALPTDKDNLFVTLTARQLNPSIRIISRVVDPSTEAKLRRAGADKVVSPNFIGGLRMVSEMIRPTVVTFLDYMLRDVDSPFRVEETTVHEGAPLAGLTLVEAAVRNQTGALIMAVRPPQKTEFMYNPPTDFVLKPGTALVVLADTRQLKRLKDLTGEPEKLLRPIIGK